VVEARSPYADADLYDVIYSWYTVDIAFYVELAKRSKGPVLEIGCGSGRVLLPTLQAGVDADGLDLAPDMLRALEAKANAAGLHPRLVQGDMRDFTMPRKYALITIPFRAFQHLDTTEDQLRALLCMREHLEPGGALVLNLFYPSAKLVAEFANQRRLEREIAHPETGLPVVLYATTTYDMVNQRLATDREIIESDARGYAATTKRMDITMRWTYRYEMELLLRNAGFSRWDVRGGFDGKPLENDTDEMIWTAWKD
jgi:SAM-dependent methyltransferase